MTYGELDARASALAARLVAAGVRPDAPVGVLAEHSPDAVVAMLGVMKAGGAYLPLDAALPPARLAWMLEDAGAAAVAIDPRLAGHLPHTSLPVLPIEEAPEATEAGTPLPAVDPRSVAYVLYTSGSTGTPKGVAVPHAAAATHLASAARRYGLTPADRVLAFAALGFDPSLEQVLAPLTAGASVALRDPRVWSAGELAGAVERMGVTLVNPPTAYWHGLAEDERAAGRIKRAARIVLTGGEAMRPDAAERWCALPGDAVLLNGYGPTEAVVTASASEVRAGARPTIGTPYPGRVLRVLDARLQPVPVGVPGELYIGGAALARGYLGRPALTAAAFVPDPFGAAGSRLYRTGDRARWTESTHALTHSRTHALEFLGRTDLQVKVRGFRVEPGEVEAAVAAHPSVREAAVVVRGEGAERRLAAYVVLTDGATAEAVRADLAARLPEYLVPSVWMALEAMPLTPTGKVDRRALPEPATAEPGAGDGEAPRGPVEELLAGIWAELLGGRAVRRTDSFFALGGHSLIAARLVSRIARVFGVELPLKALFAAPTLAALAERVEAARAAADGVERIPPIRPVPRGAEPPLSFAQERMWFLDRFAGAVGAYNILAVLRLEGPLDAEALRGALEELTARHEALRTRIAERDGRPVQAIAAPAPFLLPVTGLAGEELGAWLDEEAGRPFDLSRDLPIRAALFRTAADAHLLSLSFHHVAVDGWSVGILFRELSALYAARVEGREDALPPAALQYADFAAWQRAWLQGSALEAQTAYWRRALEGAATLELPTDRPRPAQQSFRGALHAFPIPQTVVEGVRRLAETEHVSPFMATLAAFQALLGRYAGQEDVVVGSPVAGRHRPESEGIVGLFVNTLALRTRLDGDGTFRELVRRVRETTLEGYAHQDLPFERLVDELHVERKLDRTPLFQVVFSYDAAAAEGLRLPGIRVTERSAAHRTAKFDLALNLEEAEGALTGYLEYATDLFDAATAIRLGEHYVRLLEQALADPDRPLASLDPVPEAERAALAAWNGAAAHPEHLDLPPVHLQAAAQAARTPEAIVQTWDGGRMTFAEVEERSSRLANHLAALGVRPGSRVAICMERAPEMMVAIVAAVKAGAAYVPIDHEYPAERIAWLLEDSAAPVLLTLARLAPSLPATAAQVVAVDAEWERIQAASAAPPAVQVHPEQTAYVIYTSGSTGRPKGVEIPHRALANHMAWIARAYPLGPDGVLLHKSPFGFDVSIWEFWQPLLEGGRLVLAAPGGHRDPAYLLEVIRREGATFAQFVPSMLAIVAAEPGLEACTSLRRVAGAGEALPTEIVRRIRSRLEVDVVNLYGPAEATVHTSTHVCEPDYPLAGASIGRPVDNAVVYLVDPSLRLVPRGAAGELCVGGAGVGTGYLNRPALTAERFVPDPFSAVPGGRMYRTGDRVRLAADDTLQYLGRFDFQVKVRGNRVELGEVEAALLRTPGVRETVAIVRGDALTAYVVAAEGAEVDGAALRDALRRFLPEFMVPSAVVQLDALPVTPNGKVDRKALPDPQLDEVGSAPVEPATDTERALAAAWTELLGRPVGREDGFFDAGGHSLLAMQLLARIRRRFGVEVPIRAVFEAPSLREMAARIDHALAEAGVRAVPDIVPVDRTGPLPLSFAQERMWFLDRLLPGTAVYSIPSVLRLRGPLRPEALRRALEALVHRHEALRTVFPARDGRPVQVVIPPAPFDLPLSDLSILPRDLALAEAERMVAEHARQPFDLAAGPLFRVALLRVADEEWRLLVNLHHVIADGWSLDIVFRELAELYAAGAEGRAPELPPAGVQYPDFAAWQRRWLEGEQLERQLRWWRERLAGAPVLELPADRPRPATAHFTGRSVDFRLEAETVRGIEALARAEGATPFQVVLGAFQVLLARWSGQEDVVVGSPIAGRGRPETEGMVGLFVNTLALRTELSGDPAFREVVRRVREAALGAFAHQDVPFERLVEELKVERSLSRHPLFQVSFTYQQPSALPASFGELEARLEPVETGTAKFDLLMAVEPAGDGLDGALQYAAELFDAA
ncbi:MAG TPA: amino acid adenylation domain-containing protein, partial [Longimicrobium sp.]|nr:amino acid adenylation domain-containing protein [Longimicrobium sp.]